MKKHAITCRLQYKPHAVRGGTRLHSSSACLVLVFCLHLLGHLLGLLPCLVLVFFFGLPCRLRLVPGLAWSSSYLGLLGLWSGLWSSACFALCLIGRLRLRLRLRLGAWCLVAFAFALVLGLGLGLGRLRLRLGAWSWSPSPGCLVFAFAWLLSLRLRLRLVGRLRLVPYWSPSPCALLVAFALCLIGRLRLVPYWSPSPCALLVAFALCLIGRLRLVPYWSPSPCALLVAFALCLIGRLRLVPSALCLVLPGLGLRLLLAPSASVTEKRTHKISTLLAFHVER